VQRGFLLTIFTNGTLLTERTADFLAQWRPRLLEITLYGATEGTYERVTQVPGSYARCMRGIERVLERELRLNLKTMVIRANVHEVQDMKALAVQLGVEFRYDGALWPRQDGGQQPYAQRLSSQELVALDQHDPERMAQWQEAYHRAPDLMRGETVYSCGAGRYAFQVDCTGKLSACTMSRRPAYDLLRGSFQEAWEALGALVRQKRQKETACQSCSAGLLCTQCPGWSQMVHGDGETPVEFVCELGHLRAAQFHLAGSQSRE
jgi:radical SAM protein with 4Fe4S-binding SPASM domain